MMQTYIELEIPIKKGINNRDVKRLKRVFKILDRNRVKKLFLDVYPTDVINKNGIVTSF